MKYRLLLLVAVLFSWIGRNYAAVVPESTAVETANMLLSQRAAFCLKAVKPKWKPYFKEMSRCIISFGLKKVGGL